MMLPLSLFFPSLPLSLSQKRQEGKEEEESSPLPLPLPPSHLGELRRAQPAHVVDPLDGPRPHVGRELLVAVHREPLLERELEPVSAGDAVARPVVEVLVADDLRVEREREKETKGGEREWSESPFFFFSSDVAGKKKTSKKKKHRSLTPSMRP